MRFLFTLCALICISSPILANDSSKTNPFNIKQANLYLDKIKIETSLPSTKLNTLNDAVTTLTTLVAQANQCSEDTQKELDNINTLMNQGEKLEKTSTSADLLYLNKQQKKWADIQAQCRLFTIRANEEISNYKRTALQLKEKATLTRGVPLWILYETITNTSESNLHLHTLQTIAATEFAENALRGLGILICAATLSILVLRGLKKTKFSINYLNFPRIKLLYMMLLTLSLTTGAFLIHQLITTTMYDETNPLLTPTTLIWTYFTTWLGLIFFFKIKTIRSLAKWYNLKYRFARAYLFFILNAFIIAYVGKWLNELQIFTVPFWHMCQSLYLFTILFINFNFIAYYCHSNHQRAWLKHHSRLFQSLTGFILSIPALLTLFGYLTLGLQLLYAGFVLLTILFFMGALLLGSEKLYRYINHNKIIKQKILNDFGYKEEQTFTEFLILKITSQAIVLIFGLFLIAKATGFSNEATEIAYEQFINGLHIANMTIYPTRIFLGVIIFCLIYLASRALSTKISGRQQFEDEEETQVAVASILTYFGFALAFIVGSLIAGFDFTGLAIIAGALSVGIGLGLQSIVNNFVSGLIILIEKPIKPGDRISIDGIEGVVKKIRVRSTQLITSSREDIIIPNSNLMTRNVTNFMLTDKHCRISFEIDVAYGSDTYLVRDTLLEIANQHDEVIKTERNKPTVLLFAFGENALVFRLTCLIKDVNKKSTVHSDINFEIDRVFRERKINMPFTQREIHLRINELEALKNIKS